MLEVVTDMADLVSAAIIFVISVAYVGATIFLSNRFGGRKRLKKIQSEVQAYQKEIAEATKANDEKRLKQLQLRDKEMMGMMTEMLWLPWKSAVFILPLFFLLIGTSGFLGINYDGFIPPAFPGFEIILPFEIHPGPLFAGVSFNPVSWFNLFSNLAKPGLYGSRGFFITCVIFSGIIMEAMVSRFEKKSQ